MCWRCEALGVTDAAHLPPLRYDAPDTADALAIEVAALLRVAQPGWNGVNGRPWTVTFSFAADLLAGGPAGRLAAAEWAPLDAAQRDSARQALAAWSDVSGVRFLEVADTPAGIGVDIRFNSAELRPGVVGTAAYPPLGEIWMDLTEYRASSLAPGTDGFEVVLHEVGHALGFKHPFEGGAVLPAAQDNTLNTVMSYTVLGPPRTAVGPYDAAAARHVYGTREAADAVAVRWTFDGAVGAVRIEGTAGADVVFGPDYPRTFVALGAGEDVFVGGEGRDWIAPGGGPGAVDGGGGVDTLEVLAPRLGASLTVTGTTPGGAASRAGTLGSGGEVAFVGIENFAFLDDRLVFDPADPLAQAARLFRAVLARTPDADGLNFHAATLEAGASLAEVARGFAASPEYAVRFAAPDDAGFVRLAYRNALGREATEPEIAFHRAAIASGTSREQVLANFSESPENRARTADLLAEGLWNQDEAAASVARLYRAVLDRAPEEAGLRFHVASLDGGATLAQVATGFAAGTEFAARFGAADAVGLVRLLYRNTLARDAAAAEVAFHVDRLAGTEVGALLLGFSESPEFHVRTMAGIEGGIVFA